MKKPPETRHVQVLRMGLGEAVKRLIQVEFQFRNGTGDNSLLEERRLILEAMDHIPIEIGFDCNSDGIPDNIDIFKQTATTSCCRLLPFESSREPPKPPKSPKSSEPKKASTSRRGRTKPVPEDPPPPTDPPASPKKGGFLNLFGGKK